MQTQSYSIRPGTVKSVSDVRGLDRESERFQLQSSALRQREERAVVLTEGRVELQTRAAELRVGENGGESGENTQRAQLDSNNDN